MKISRLLIVLTVLQGSTVWAQEEIIACNLDLISTNKPSDQIVKSLTSTISLLASVGMISSYTLWRNTESIHEWAKEFETNTIGKGYIVKKLANKIHSELGINLPDDAIKQMIDMGTEPIVNQSALTKIKQLLEKGKRIIGFCNQDRLEYEIYRNKMAQQNVKLSQLFAAIVIIPSYEDTQIKWNQTGYHKYSNSSPLYLSSKPYPSSEFISALNGASGDIGYHDPISIINNPEQLVLATESKK